MISKHVDLLAVGALLLAIIAVSQFQNAFRSRVVRQRTILRVERLEMRVPRPPVVPIVLTE